MGHRDIVVIGASSGGFEVLREIARGLPADLPAAVFVVLHSRADSPRVLADVLAHDGLLPAGYPGDGDSIRSGRIYVAPPDQHLALEERRVRVVRGPKQNRHRPAVDVLFRSAAFAHGPRAIGVVLSGALDDGAAGLAAIKRSGGLAVVHDPDDAAYPEMPLNALGESPADYTVPARDIATLLARLTREEVEGLASPDPTLGFEVQADRGDSDMTHLDAHGRRSVYTCPDCHGTLWEIGDAELTHYRCHVGHGFTTGSLLGRQGDTVEDAVWAAIRAMEENARLSRRVGQRLVGTGAPDELRAKAETLERQAGLLRGLMIRQAS